MLISFIGIVPLIASDALWGMVVFSTLFTVLDASIPVIWAAVGDFFGRRRFGTIRGTMSFFYMWGSVLGPYLAGVMYDRAASYARRSLAPPGAGGGLRVTTTLLVRPWSGGWGATTEGHGATSLPPRFQGLPVDSRRGRKTYG